MSRTDVEIKTVRLNIDRRAGTQMYPAYCTSSRAADMPAIPNRSIINIIIKIMMQAFSES
jgi:hypothetical protein